MKGPVLPIYGAGAVIILFVTMPFMENPFLVYIFSFLAATVLELVTGIVMETLFKVRYWDYTKNFMNYKGYICIKSSITWGFMGVFITYVVNEPVASFIDSLSRLITSLVVAVCTVIFALDFVQSFRAAYNLREMILNNERLIKELNELKINIAVAVTQAENVKEEVVAGIKYKIDTALSYTEIDDYILDRIEEFKKLDVDDYILQWKEKANLLKSRIEMLDKSKIAMLKRNPSAKSKFGFLKEAIEFYRRNKN